MENKTDKSIRRVFKDAVDYAKKNREHGAYLFLNSRAKTAAVRRVAKELVVGGVRTEILEVEGDLFKIEPIFDKEGKYVCEECVYLGTMNKDLGITTDKPSKNLI